MIHYKWVNFTVPEIHLKTHTKETVTKSSNIRIQQRGLWILALQITEPCERGQAISCLQALVFTSVQDPHHQLIGLLIRCYRMKHFLWSVSSTPAIRYTHLKYLRWTLWLLKQEQTPIKSTLLGSFWSILRYLERQSMEGPNSQAQEQDCQVQTLVLLFS